MYSGNLTEDWVRFGPSLILNKNHIQSLEMKFDWDGIKEEQEITLIATMASGEKHKMRHEPSKLDFTDCYLVQDRIMVPVLHMVQNH